jgi:septal ring factor EnvC (AmiA/AmiB activator)|tara:strand:+ start:2875 stop:3324 length:450 start_codon:yes stop_codon:yes gene_type:complete
MAEIEYQGMKFKGGKIFIIISLIGTIIGGGWTGFTFYQDYLDMKEKIQSYTAPDLSHIDEQIAVLKSEVSMVLEEVSLVNDVATSLKNDLRDDIKTMKSDIRAIDKVVNDIEDRVKANEREISEDFKILEKEIDDKIRKALNNPLAGVQ